MEKRRWWSTADGLLRVAVAVAVAAASAAAAEREVPAMYVFGDSLVDVGNNDFLPPPAPRAPEPPCGVDLPPGFAGGGGGRFTNGFNLADIIAQHVGFKMSPPAYLSLTTPGRRGDLRRGLVGVNYASSGSGILDFTGNGTISLGEQVKLFANTKAAMVAAGEVDGERINHLLSRSLFITCTGGNDYDAFTDGIVPVSEAPAFIAHMVTTYIKHIKTLYKLGARRLGILDMLPLGCLPISRLPMENGSCSEEDNWQGRLFNRLIRREMAAAVAGSMPDLKYSIGSIYHTFTDMTVNPDLAGLKEVARACCGDGKLNAEADCSANAKLCPDRDDYIFWDRVHGTQAAYHRCVHGFFHGSPRYAEPISFTQLVTPPAVDLEHRSPRTNRTARI
ncbi:GDSL esterase/lipase At4g28780-like [Oryza brachyantha]|uniref:GDSL esterase/lipase At4g28780-like n=1 Tax=Oryza brachyantha TaxID=4533 RepID=UPI0007764BC0|nr:GDSL esterase/lipase At4g28780-like [Oryza brachyantha]